MASKLMANGLIEIILCLFPEAGVLSLVRRQAVQVLTLCMVHVNVRRPPLEEHIVLEGMLIAGRAKRAKVKK